MQNQVIILAEMDTDYYRNKQRPQQIAERLAKDNYVVFMEAPSTPLLFWLSNNYKQLERKANYTKGLRQHQTITKLYLYTPPPTWFPLTRLPWINKLYYKFLLKHLEQQLTKHGLQPSLLWLNQAAAFPLASKYSRLPVIVDWTRPWEELALNYINKNPFTRWLNIQCKRYWIRRILTRANLIFANAIKYYEYAKAYNLNTHLFYSGADINTFTNLNADQLESDLPDLAALARPLLGVVAARINQDIIDLEAIILSAQKHPEWTFVFIGQKMGDLAVLEQLPNIHFVGYKDHSQLPAYLRTFDVNLIPYRINTLTQSGIPTKLPEYLAVGKPVVSTYLEEIHRAEDFCAVTYLAKTPGEFCDQIEQALVEDNPELQFQRRDLALRYDWDSIVSRMRMLINGILVESEGRG